MLAKLPHSRFTRRLNDDQWTCAEAVGGIRRRKNRGGITLLVERLTPEDLLENDVRSVGAEIAASHLFNVCWSGCGPGGYDIGNCADVRMIMDLHRGLLVNPRDSDDTPIVLMYLDTETLLYAALGWEFAGAVKKRGVYRTANSHTGYWTLAGPWRSNDDLCEWFIERKLERLCA